MLYLFYSTWRTYSEEYTNAFTTCLNMHVSPHSFDRHHRNLLWWYHINMKYRVHSNNIWTEAISLTNVNSIWNMANQSRYLFNCETPILNYKLSQSIIGILLRSLHPSPAMEWFKPPLVSVWHKCICLNGLLFFW